MLISNILHNLSGILPCTLPWAYVHMSVRSVHTGWIVQQRNLINPLYSFTLLTLCSWIRGCCELSQCPAVPAAFHTVPTGKWRWVKPASSGVSTPAATRKSSIRITGKQATQAHSGIHLPVWHVRITITTSSHTAFGQTCWTWYPMRRDFVLLSNWLISYSRCIVLGFTASVK